jgi:hypothetical protein
MQTRTVGERRSSENVDFHTDADGLKIATTARRPKDTNYRKRFAAVHDRLWDHSSRPIEIPLHNRKPTILGKKIAQSVVFERCVGLKQEFLTQNGR